MTELLAEDKLLVSDASGEQLLHQALLQALGLCYGFINLQDCVVHCVEDFGDLALLFDGGEGDGYGL